MIASTVQDYCDRRVWLKAWCFTVCFKQMGGRHGLARGEAIIACHIDGFVVRDITFSVGAQHDSGEPTAGLASEEVAGCGFHDEIVGRVRSAGDQSFCPLSSAINVDSPAHWSS